MLTFSQKSKAKTILVASLAPVHKRMTFQQNFDLLQSTVLSSIDITACGLSAKDRDEKKNPVSDLELNLSKTATKAIEFY